MKAVEIDRVTKRFGSHVAVDDLSLQVPDGAIYGFIGPNGSGKTTTLRMLLHILLPDQGTIRVFGDDRTDRSRDRIGYLPEERGLYKKMRVRRLLRYYGQLKGAPLRVVDAEIDRWLDRLGMTAWQEKNVDALSKGMAQKIQFIAAVVSRPDLLILDEPFSGLDPVNAQVLKDAVLAVREAGTTVIFSTHDMDVAERMCDRICMISRGRKVLDGTLAEIQDVYRTDTIRLRIDGGIDVLRTMEPGLLVNDFGQLQEVRGAGDPQALLSKLVDRTRVHHFEVTRPSLHDIFVRMAGPEADSAAAHTPWAAP